MITALQGRNFLGPAVSFCQGDRSDRLRVRLVFSILVTVQLHLDLFHRCFYRVVPDAVPDFAQGQAVLLVGDGHCGAVSVHAQKADVCSGNPLRDSSSGCSCKRSCFFVSIRCVVVPDKIARGFIQCIVCRGRCFHKLIQVPGDQLRAACCRGLRKYQVKAAVRTCILRPNKIPPCADFIIVVYRKGCRACRDG